MIFSLALPAFSFVAVAQGGAVASVNEVEYASLAEALAALSGGETVILLADTAEKVTVSKSATIDGNGKTLSGSVTVSGGAALTVKNIKILSGSSAALATSGGSSLSVLSGYYNASGANPAVLANGNSTVNIYGGFFLNSGNSRAVNSTNGASNTVNIYGGTFTVTNTGAAVRITNSDTVGGSLNIYGGIYSNLTSGDRANCYALAGSYTAHGGYYYLVKGMVGTSVSGMSDRDRNGLYIQTASVGLPEMRDGASVRLLAGSNGIRFTTDISAATLDYVKSIPGVGAEIGYGTVITPTDQLTKVTSFTAEALDAAGLAYVDIAANKGIVENADGSVTVNAALTDIKESNINRPFSAVPYITYTVNGNTVRTYGAYSYNDNSRSMAQVALMALDDGYGAAQVAVLEKYAGYNLMLTDIGIENYSIVYPANPKASELDFAKQLHALIYARTGADLTIRDDSTVGEYEMLVGNTARTKAKVGETEYTVAVNGTRFEFLADSYMGYSYIVEETFGDLVSVMQSAEETWKCTSLYERDYTEKIIEDENTSVLNKSGEIRVMYHNVWGWDNAGTANGYPTSDSHSEQRSAILEEVYLTYDPDILCLQEYTYDVMRGCEGSITSRLEAAGYAEVPVVSTSYATGTPILYKPDKVTPVDYGVYNLESSTNKDKFVTWVVFQKPDGTKLGVVSLHLAYEGGDVGNNKRLAQAQTVTDTVDAIIAEHGCPVMIGGDFNCAVNSAPYNKFIELGFSSVWDLAAVKENSTTSFGYPYYDAAEDRIYRKEVNRKTHANAIDHIMVKGSGLIFKTFDIVIDPFAGAGSDHMATIAEFSFDVPHPEDWTFEY